CYEAFEDILGDYADRLMFEKGKVHNLAGKVLNAIELDARSRLVLGKALRDIVVQGHSVDRLIGRWIATFQGLIK
ncbi:MAG: hypothetical protein ACE5NN_07860, partial [Candidatus Bathyarchaeia archaeon]